MLLLDTLPMLGNVLLLCFFVFFIFGIIGVQLWAGLLRQRCYIPEENVNAIVKSAYWRYVCNRLYAMNVMYNGIDSTSNVENIMSQYQLYDIGCKTFICFFALLRMCKEEKNVFILDSTNFMSLFLMLITNFLDIKYLNWHQNQYYLFT